MANNYSYLDGMSTSELKERKNQNSADWHTDPWQRKNYEAENKAIMSILDQREGTKSSFDSGTGKWNTTGGGTGASDTKTSGSGTGGSKYGLTPSDILALGKGPLSSAAADRYIETGSTKPGLSSFAINNAPRKESSQPVQQGYTQADLDAAVAAEREKQKQQSEYDLSEYIKKQKAAELESQLAGLKGAYEQSVAQLRSAQDKLPGAYEDARNSAAAQAALAKRRFLEGAAYQGLGSGTAGQAELTHGATLTGTLSQIDRAQADSQAELDLEETTLASRYQQAIQQARANEDSEMATALYQELVRQQGLEREDKQLAQVQEQLLYNQKKAEEALAYEKEQAARTEAQKRVDAYLAALGKSADLDQDLLTQSGYTQGELNALERYYAQLIGLEEKYTGVPHGYGISSGAFGDGSVSDTGRTALASENTEPAFMLEPSPASYGPSSKLDWENRDSYTPGTLDWENRDEYGMIPDTVTRDLRPYAKNLLKQLQGGISKANWLSLIENALRYQDIDEYEANYIMDQLGYD